MSAQDPEIAASQKRWEEQRRKTLEELQLLRRDIKHLLFGWLGFAAIITVIAFFAPFPWNRVLPVVLLPIPVLYFNRALWVRKAFCLLYLAVTIMNIALVIFNRLTPQNKRVAEFITPATLLIALALMPRKKELAAERVRQKYRTP